MWVVYVSCVCGCLHHVTVTLIECVNTLLQSGCAAVRAVCVCLHVTDVCAASTCVCVVHMRVCMSCRRLVCSVDVSFSPSDMDTIRQHRRDEDDEREPVHGPVARLAHHIRALTVSGTTPIATLASSTATSHTLIPLHYAQPLLMRDAHVTQHVRWMQQKWTLKQDMFLIGSTGKHDWTCMYSMQHATCTCNMQHAICNIQHATCNMECAHATYNMQHNMQHVTCNMHTQHTTCNMQHAICNMLHGYTNMHISLTCVCVA